jgi:hypothetical protein
MDHPILIKLRVDEMTQKQSLLFWVAFILVILCLYIFVFFFGKPFLLSIDSKTCNFSFLFFTCGKSAGKCE